MFRYELNSESIDGVTTTEKLAEIFLNSLKR